MSSKILSLLGGALALGLVALPAQAAPVSNVGSALANLVGTTQLVQQVRRYRHHRGGYRYRRYGSTCWIDGAYVCGGSSYRYRSYRRYGHRGRRR